MGTAQPFAVNGDELALGHLEYRAHPGKEAFLELLGAQPCEDVAEGVVRGDAVGEFHKAPEPLDLGFAELLDFDPVVGAADDGTDGDGEDVDELMVLVTLNAWVIEGGKAVGEAGKRGLVGHWNILLARPRSRPE